MGRRVLELESRRRRFVCFPKLRNLSRPRDPICRIRNRFCCSISTFRLSSSPISDHQTSFVRATFEFFTRDPAMGNAGRAGKKRKRTMWWQNTNLHTEKSKHCPYPSVPSMFRKKGKCFGIKKETGTPGCSTLYQSAIVCFMRANGTLSIVRIEAFVCFEFLIVQNAEEKKKFPSRDFEKSGKIPRGKNPFSNARIFGKKCPMVSPILRLSRFFQSWEKKMGGLIRNWNNNRNANFRGSETNENVDRGIAWPMLMLCHFFPWYVRKKSKEWGNCWRVKLGRGSFGQSEKVPSLP